MIYAIFIMILMYSPLIMAIAFMNRRKIFKLFFNFVRHREIRFFLLSIAKFVINIGASAAAFVFIAYFIPQAGVTLVMLIKVGGFGTMISLAGYYIERFLK